MRGRFPGGNGKIGGKTAKTDALAAPGFGRCSARLACEGRFARGDVRAHQRIERPCVA